MGNWKFLTTKEKILNNDIALTTKKEKKKMKIAISGEWGGGFCLTKKVARILGVKTYDDSDAVRTNPILIKMLEEGEEIEDLEIVEIPDNATDYKITEYDGIERVIYVVDGKLYYA